MSDTPETPESPLWLSFIFSQLFFITVISIIHFGFDPEIRNPDLGFVEGVGHGLLGPVSIWRTIFGGDTDLKDYFAHFSYDVGFMMGFWVFLQVIDRCQGPMIQTIMGADISRDSKRRAIALPVIYIVGLAAVLPFTTPLFPEAVPVDEIPRYLGILGGSWRFYIQLGLFGLGSTLFTLVTLGFSVFMIRRATAGFRKND